MVQDDNFKEEFTYDITNNIISKVKLERKDYLVHLEVVGCWNVHFSQHKLEEKKARKEDVSIDGMEHYDRKRNVDTE